MELHVPTSQKTVISTLLIFSRIFSVHLFVSLMKLLLLLRYFHAFLVDSLQSSLSSSSCCQTTWDRLISGSFLIVYILSTTSSIAFSRNYLYLFIIYENSLFLRDLTIGQHTRPAEALVRCLVVFSTSTVLIPYEGRRKEWDRIGIQPQSLRTRHSLFFLLNLTF
jgi:hypothetical protein